VSDHDPPATACKSTVTEHPRIVGLMNEHPRPVPAPTVAELARIERRTELPAPGPALALEAELGKSKLRALACSPLAIVAVVLIVLIIMTGKVLIAWHEGAQREVPGRPDLARCPEWTCTRDGS